MAEESTPCRRPFLMPPSGEVTRLLARLSQGEQGAADELLPLIYAELHRVASDFMAGRRPGDTLQPTALVHETYLRLFPAESEQWKDREHFLAVAAKAMHSVLIDHARRRNAQKRGDGAKSLPFDDALLLAFEERATDLLALEEALGRLSTVSERAARVVELRFFGGLSTEEIARSLAVTPCTVARDWQAARAWLHQALSDDERA
jgi:RNA polymerase sigma factor (TIGR02999 family)